jgi:putative endonuclease
MYSVYIIKSEKTGRCYIGSTSDMVQRLRHHNSGANKSTKNRGPWLLVYQEVFSEKREAWIREKQIKKYKGGNAFKKLIETGRVA